MTQASAPGKVILFGEHAVVFGRPAIAVPVHQVAAKAEVDEIPSEEPGRIFLKAPDVHFHKWLHEMEPEQPLAKIIQLTLRELGLKSFPALNLRLTSTIPIASGLGSSAAVSVAIVRALSAHFGNPLPLQKQSALAFQVEILHHGNPSGVDNTVVTYGQPVYYLSGQEVETFTIPTPLTLLIGDTGIPSPTALAVAKVRQAWKAAQQRYEALFDAIGKTVEQAKDCLVAGSIQDLGPLMDHNQVLLERLGVSSEELERLIRASRRSGAQGAKLSGAGLGGNMIALVSPQNALDVERSLYRAGADFVIKTKVG